MEVRGGGGGEEEEEEEKSCIVRWPRWQLVSGALSFNVVLFWISFCDFGWFDVSFGMGLPRSYICPDDGM